MLSIGPSHVDTGQADCLLHAQDWMVQMVGLHPGDIERACTKSIY